jgi:hypothetical protein
MSTLRLTLGDDLPSVVSVSVRKSRCCLQAGGISFQQKYLRFYGLSYSSYHRYVLGDQRVCPQRLWGQE